jgi:hypothetical protein
MSNHTTTQAILQTLQHDCADAGRRDCPAGPPTRGGLGMSAQVSRFAALLALRAAAATVVELADAAMLGTPRDAAVATRALPNALRTLQRQLPRALAAFDTKKA